MLLTSALVDYAFTLLEHALSLVVKLAFCGPELALCLFLRKMRNNSLSRKHCHSPLLTCHSPAELARWLLPAPSSPVICLSVRPSRVQWATCWRGPKFSGGKKPETILGICAQQVWNTVLSGGQGQICLSLVGHVATPKGLVLMPEERSPQLLKGIRKLRWTPKGRNQSKERRRGILSNWKDFRVRMDAKISGTQIAGCCKELISPRGCQTVDPASLYSIISGGSLQPCSSMALWFDK